MSDLSGRMRAYFERGPWEGARRTGNWPRQALLNGGGERAWERLLYERHASVFLRHTIARRPGHRPWAWWEFDAPRWEDGLPEHVRDFPRVWAIPRRRIGGTGTPAWECPEMRAMAPLLNFGVPLLFGSDYDPADPPRYESEADYLTHHDLLAPGEADVISDATRRAVYVAPPDSVMTVGELERLMADGRAAGLPNPRDGKGHAR